MIYCPLAVFYFPAAGDNFVLRQPFFRSTRRLNRKGMYKLYPPFGQLWVAFAHLVDVLFRVFGVDKGRYNIFNCEPPFVLMDRLSYLFTSEDRYLEIPLIISNRCGFFNIIALWRNKQGFSFPFVIYPIR